MSAVAVARIDHLVFACASLEQAVAWSEQHFGVTPGPGGEHPLMGTHNRLVLAPSFSDNKSAFVSCYIEFIAINPNALSPQHARWFGLDNPALQARIAEQPQLVTFVASVPNIAAASSALAAHGYPPGSALEASRETAHAQLRWKITVTVDGEPHAAGLVPTLIEWASAHPSANMPPAGVQLLALQCQHPEPAKLQAAHLAMGLSGVEYALAGAAQLRCQLQTPRGVLWA